MTAIFSVKSASQFDFKLSLTFGIFLSGLVSGYAPLCTFVTILNEQNRPVFSNASNIARKTLKTAEE